MWDVHNKNASSPLPVTIIPSPNGSRANDVKAAAMNSGDILVHSNEACAAGGPGGFEIYNVDDPANPVLASTFNTVCSAHPADPACAPAGTYSAHNVIVETTGNKVKAYVSWYSDGLRVLDVSDPSNPVEVARFLDDSTNDGEPNDFWGVYKEHNSPFIYGSDRNGGLYILKEQGSGSGKK